jgi:hypothetical protein
LDSDCRIQRSRTLISSVSALSAATPSAGIAPGGLKLLYDVVATVSATITNNGTVEGKEVAQLLLVCRVAVLGLLVVRSSS